METASLSFLREGLLDVLNRGNMLGFSLLFNRRLDATIEGLMLHKAGMALSTVNLGKKVTKYIEFVQGLYYRQWEELYRDCRRLHRSSKGAVQGLHRAI